MQRYEYNFEYLLEAAKNAEIDTDELVKMWDTTKNKYAETYTSQQREKIITSVKNKLVEKDEQHYIRT